MTALNAQINGIIYTSKHGSFINNSILLNSIVEDFVLAHLITPSCRVCNHCRIDSGRSELIHIFQFGDSRWDWFEWMKTSSVYATTITGLAHPPCHSKRAIETILVGINGIHITSHKWGQMLCWVCYIISLVYH